VCVEKCEFFDAVWQNKKKSKSPNTKTEERKRERETN
jgi:hypothetical protein